MYNYPIFKHLIQFSNLLDADGKLIQHAMQPAPTHYGTNPKHEDSDGGDGEEDYDDEAQDDFDGKDDEKEGGQAESQCEESQNGYEGGEGEQNPAGNQTQQPRDAGSA